MLLNNSPSLKKKIITECHFHLDANLSVLLGITKFQLKHSTVGVTNDLKRKKSNKVSVKETSTLNNNFLPVILNSEKVQTAAESSVLTFLKKAFGNITNSEKILTLPTTCILNSFSLCCDRSTCRKSSPHNKK
jgi:hypothetical protein